jgi:hypothetical protein
MIEIVCVIIHYSNYVPKGFGSEKFFPVILK